MIVECFDNRDKKILLCFIVYILFSIPVVLLTLKFVHVMMVWNVFLSLLPLFFAKLMQKASAGPNKLKIIILSILWLVFFPNAPYMITDFIHISTVVFYVRGSQTVPTTGLIPWIRLIHISIGIMLGTLSGLLSLYTVHSMLLKRKGKIAANTVLAVACLLGGFGIYLGRFLRFNSWDLLRPVSLFSRLVNNLDTFVFFFSLLAAFYVFASYCIFYAFFHQK